MPARRPLTLVAALAGLAGTGAAASLAAGHDSPTPRATVAAVDLEAARDAAVRWAMTQVGHREVGTTNCSSRITAWQKAMGLKAPPCRPWCGALPAEAYRRAGIRLSSRMIDPDKTADDAIAGRRKLRRIPIAQARRGDLLLFKLRDDVRRASHIALVRGRAVNGSIPTVEGNVSHAVRLSDRGTDFPVMAVRVTG